MRRGEVQRPALVMSNEPVQESGRSVGCGGFNDNRSNARARDDLFHVIGDVWRRVSHKAVMPN